jgi:hypothetical protein
MRVGHALTGSELCTYSKLTLISFKTPMGAPPGSSHALLMDLLHKVQHGSIPGRMALDPIILTQLSSDLCLVLKHDYARFDNDASSCYDSIIVGLGMLAARKCGMPSHAIRTHADALQFIKYTKKLKFYFTCFCISVELTINPHGPTEP